MPLPPNAAVLPSNVVDLRAYRFSKAVAGHWRPRVQAVPSTSAAAVQTSDRGPFPSA